VSRFDWLSLKRLLRDRDQLTVELAEEGVAPEDEVHAVEERVEHGIDRRGEHSPPTSGEGAAND
jgi:hypothetical protein